MANAPIVPPIVPPPSEEQLAEIDAKYPRKGRVVHSRGVYTVIFRAPKRQEFKAFREKIHNPARKAAAQEELARTLVVYPIREKFDELLEEYPALCDGEAVSNVLNELMNGSREDDEK